tara:strand:- start:266 stop:1516 length:1251 start_codon:yes stop_codon:yes gene_type:complete
MTTQGKQVQEMLSGFRSLPRRLRLAVALGVFLFVAQLSFVASHVQAHLFGHLALTLYYIFVVFHVQRAHQMKVNRFLSAIDNSCLVVKFNVNGTIQSANDLFCEALGYTAGEIRGIQHSALVPERDRNSDAYAAFWKKLREGQSWHGLYERRSKTGESVWIVGSYTPLKDDGHGVTQVLKVARDVTDHIKDRYELKKKNTYLEHAAKILRHDMHSGINIYIPRGVRSLERRLKQCPDVVEALNLDMPLRLIKEGLTHTQRVYRGVKEFTNLVRTDAELEKKSHKLNQILSDHLSTTAYRSQVIIEALPSAEVNASLFCTAIDNLIRNGLKYNDSSTKIVRVTSDHPDQILIIDNGRGMNAQDFEMYSKPYTRKPDQQESGTGLGLSICLAILHEHGFQVSCGLNPGGGTILTVSFS